MTRKDARAVEEAVAALADRLAKDPRLHAEVHRARRQFFGADASPAAVVRGAAASAEHRFAEWFTLERESEVLGAVPADLPQYGAEGSDLTGSMAGVFLVTSVASGGVDARDLQDETMLDLAVPTGSLQQGDLLVGRLFERAAGRWTPSTAAAVFRPGAEIGEAFRRDVQRLELGRRLQQVEVEHLLLRRVDQTPSPTAEMAPAVPLEHLEADLDRLLQAGGSNQAAADVSQMLAEVVRPGQVMGPLLEQLAFESNVDLDKARALMLEIWNAYHGADLSTAAGAVTPIAEAPGETLGERLVRTLDEGLRQKRDVDDLFAQLERMAGLEPGAADEGENPFDASEEEDEAEEPSEDDELLPELAGDLAPLVQEFLWENDREQDPAAAPLRLLVQLQANAALPRTDLESVTGQDLMRLLLHVYLAAPQEERAAHVRTAFQVLQEFYAWVEATQELSVGAALQDCRGSLLEQVDRLEAASRLLSGADRPGLRPGILQVEDVGPAGFGVRDDEGGDHWLEAPPPAVAELRVGDLVLGALEAGRHLAGFVVVLPQDAASLME